MSHAKNKVDWCLKKAEKELKETGKHRGLLIIKENAEKSKEHIKKAEHNLKLLMHLKNNNFSDWCGPAAFYSVYHCLLAVLSKFGYESRNQECTFAFIYNLIEENKINFEKEMIKEIMDLYVEESVESHTIIGISEQYQYGTKLSIEDK